MEVNSNDISCRSEYSQNAYNLSATHTASNIWLHIPATAKAFHFIFCSLFYFNMLSNFLLLYLVYSIVAPFRALETGLWNSMCNVNSPGTYMTGSILVVVNIKKKYNYCHRLMISISTSRFLNTFINTQNKYYDRVHDTIFALGHQTHVFLSIQVYKK